MAVRGSVAWMAFGQGSLFLVQLIGSVIVARLLGPFDMGIFAVAMAAVGIIGVLQTVGLGSFLIRERELTPEVVATASSVNVVICLIMAATIAIVGWLGAALFREPGVRDVLLVIAVVPIIGHFAFVPQTMLQRDGNFRTSALITAGSSATGLIITVWLAAHGYRYMSLAYSQVATAVLTNTAVNIVGRRYINMRWSLTHWSRVAQFGAQIFAIGGLNAVASRTMELVLGKVLGLAALGVFTRASSNHGQIWGSVHGVVNSVIFVDFARYRREGRPLDARYLQVLELMTGLMWPLFGGVAVLAGPLVWLVYGHAWLAAATPLALLCVASILLVSTTMTWELFVIFEETARQVRLEVIRTLLGTVLFVIACFYSLAAVAAARVIEAAFAQWLYRPHIERLTGASRAGFHRVYRRSGAATAVAVLPALAVMSYHRFSPFVPVEQVAAAVAAGGLLWLLTLRRLQHPVYGELTTLLRRVRRIGVPA